MSAELSADKSAETLAEIKAALHHPDACIRFQQTFNLGRAVQVCIKSRKVGPYIVPSEGQTTADVLRMLAGLMAGADFAAEPAIGGE